MLYEGAKNTLESLMMNDGYCFRCGAYTAIDQLTKMCRPCFDHWCATPRRRPS